MLIARQSTARTVTVGPVLDASGVAVTDCVVADFEGSVNGGDPAALNGSATLTHRGVGFYSLALTATDLGTVGSFEVVINDTVNACPIKELTVVEEAVYDALFAASALGYVANAPVNVAQISGDSTAADNCEAFFDGTGYAGTNNVIPTVTTLTNLPAITAGWLTGVGTDDTFYSEIANRDVGLAGAPADGSALKTLEVQNVAGVSGSVGGNVQGKVLGGGVTAITGTGARVVDASGNAVATAAALDTVDDLLDTEVAAIKAKTDLIPATPAAVGDIPTVAQIWTTALTEAYRATGATGTGAQLLYEILQNLVDFSISGTTKTAKTIAGGTAKTYTLDSSTAPTSITELS